MWPDGELELTAVTKRPATAGKTFKVCVCVCVCVCVFLLQLSRWTLVQHLRRERERKWQFKHHSRISLICNHLNLFFFLYNFFSSPIDLDERACGAAVCKRAFLCALYQAQREEVVVCIWSGACVASGDNKNSNYCCSKKKRKRNKKRSYISLNSFRLSVFSNIWSDSLPWTAGERARSPCRLCQPTDFWSFLHALQAALPRNLAKFQVRFYCTCFFFCFFSPPFPLTPLSRGDARNASIAIAKTFKLVEVCVIFEHAHLIFVL